MTTGIGRTWKLWAYRYESGALWHIGAHAWVKLHGLDRPLVPVLAEEILGDRYAAAVTHYGWSYNDASPCRVDDVPSMIQIRAGNDPKDPKRALMLLSVCVGINAKNDDNVVALRITERAVTREEEAAFKLAEDCDRLRRDNQRLVSEVNSLRAEVERLTPLACASIPLSRDLDDAATRFSLLELD